MRINCMLQPSQTKPVLLGGWLLLGPKEYRQYNQDTEFPLKKKKSWDVFALAFHSLHFNFFFRYILNHIV